MVSCAVPPTAYSTSRLLGGGGRAASITFSPPGTRVRTQASNFFRRRPSAAPADTSTVSMPNWRKHSVSRNLEDSLRSTRATRAVAFLTERTGASAVPNAFSMTRAGYQYESLLWRGQGQMERPQWTGREYKSVITLVGLVGSRRAKVREGQLFLLRVGIVLVNGSALHF